MSGEDDDEEGDSKHTTRGRDNDFDVLTRFSWRPIDFSYARLGETFVSHYLQLSVATYAPLLTS